MGTLLVVLTLGVLVVDQWFQPWYPFLLVLLLALALVACSELLGLLEPTRRPSAWLCYATVTALVAGNWVPHLLGAPAADGTQDPWHWTVGTFSTVVLAAFLLEMATFREPGEAVTRIALTVWVASYVGLLPGFLAQLRWVPGGSTPGMVDRGTLALALAVFVPKCGDIGAYFTGRFLGRHRLTPVLSPKKTWEGVVGGLAAAVLAAAGIDLLGPALTGEPVLAGGLLAVVGFGITVGVAGMLGDLAESLIKRDCRRKDASQSVPGFGGVLDVVDSVVFAAPVAYWWLRC
jgi:phosphatidate cytidylyltransferase